MININYNSAAALRTFLEEEGLAMQKKFGQNFLINPKTRQTLAQALGANAGDEVWEIGPGLGAMTALLLENGCRLRAFEIDAGFIRVLKRLFADEKDFSLIEGDVMKTWKKNWHKENPPVYLLGNLPYNIAAAILADFIESGCLFSRIVVTVQKEVALRMAASAGSPDYSSFSVLCASVYKVKPFIQISPSSFFPQPNVDSTGVLLERLPLAEIPAGFYPLVRSLFASRRKTIKNNLASFISSHINSLQKENKTTEFHREKGNLGVKTLCSSVVKNYSSVQDVCASIFKENGLSGMERAETLELEAFLSLAKSIENMRLLK